MFLQNAKRQHTCSHCNGIIEREEIFCVMRIARAGRDRPFLIKTHFACYIPFQCQVLQKKYDSFAGRGIVRPKMGRPMVPTTDRQKRRKLISLRAYHRKMGHDQEVEKINLEIKNLEVESEVSNLQDNVEETAR